MSDGVRLNVRLTPKSASDAVDGVGRLADGSQVAMVRVRALPAKGAANAALVAVLARTLKVPKQSVTIVGGGNSRVKRIQVAGDVGALSGTIERWPKLF